MNKLVTLAVGAAALALVSSASANVLYDNPNSGYETDAWTINFGYSVADSFTLGANSTVTGVSFATWDFPGEVASGVDWAIYDGNPLNGSPNLLAGGTAVSSATLLETNSLGYDILNNTFSTGSVNLAGGTYWLLLSNAANPAGDPVFWDQGDGPSEAWENSIGQLPGDNPCTGLCTGSETFQILGPSGVPEPATWALMLVGFAGLGAAMRSRRQTATA